MERIFLEKEVGTDRPLHYSHLCPPAACKNLHCMADGHGVVESSAVNQERRKCH